MGLLYREIDRHEVVNALKQKGYGEYGTRRYALAFNKPTGERWQSGSEKREFAFGVTAEQLDLILKHSESVDEAARRIEAVGLGREQVGGESRVEHVPGGGLSMEVVEKLIENRAASEVSRQMAPVHRELANLAKGLSTSLELIANLSSKKAGRPKGSKNKPKVEDAAPAA